MHSATLIADVGILRAGVERDPTIRLFWFLVTGHVLIWMAVCLFTQPNMPLDMVEMLYWGQQWQPGYHKHPPLPAWTAATAWSISCGHPWTIYLSAQLTIAVTFWAVWQFARESLNPWAALCAVAVLEGCYYCTFLINDINNTIMTRPFWALAVLFLYRALVRKKVSTKNLYWVMAGVVIGLGMLSKYYMGVLVLAMMAVPLFVPRTRRELKSTGPWLAMVTAVLVFLPHFLWMLKNDFITIKYVLNRSGEAAAQGGAIDHLTSPVYFVVSQLPAVIPVIVLATPLLLNRGAAKEESVDVQSCDKDFFKHYLQVVFLGPILIYIVLGVATGATIRSMWGAPLFSFLGVLLFVWNPLPNDQKKVIKIFRDAILIGLLMAVALTGRNVLGPKFRGEQSKVHFPGREVSTLVQQRWNEHYTNNIPVVGGQLFLSGCVGVYAAQPIDVYGDMSPAANPWTGDEDLQTRGGMIVWDHNESGALPPDKWLSRFENVEVLEPVVSRSRSFTDNVEVRIGVAIVHPSSAERLAFAVKGRGNMATRAASTERIASEPGTTSPISR